MASPTAARLRQSDAIARARPFAAALAVLVVQLVAFPMPMGTWLQGVVLGLLNALLALGLTLIWRANRILNFAQADMGTLPAALGVGCILLSGVPYLVGLAVGLVAAIVVGVVVQVVVVRRFRHAPRLTLTVATIGISQFLIIAALLAPRLWGSQVLTAAGGTGYTFPLTLSFSVGQQVFHADDVVAAIVAVACLAGVARFLRRSDTGIAIRAAAERSERASLLGVPVVRMELVTWVTASVLSFLGVFLQGAILGFPLNATVGVAALVAALAALALGGFDHFGAILAAAVSVGVLLQGVRWHNSIRPSVTYAVLGAVIGIAMLVRRSGASRAERVSTSSWPASLEPRPLPARLGFAVPQAIAVVLLVAAAALLPVSWSASTQYELATLVAFGVIALSIAVLTGWAGQVTLGQMGFAATGAALGATATVTWRLDVTLGLAIAALAGAAVGAIVGLPALRFKGLLPAATTLAFGLAAAGYVFDPNQFSWIPSGDVVPQPALGLWNVASPLGAYELSLVVLVAVALGLGGIRASTLGRAMRAHRDNELSAQSFGIGRARARLGAYALSGAVASIGGFLLVHTAQHFDTATYAPTESLTIFTASVLGGVGSLAGVLLGAGYLQGSRWLLDGYWQLLPTAVGVLVVLMIFPGGLASLAYRVRDRVASRRAASLGIALADPADDADAVVEPAHPVAASNGHSAASVVHEPDRSEPDQSGRDRGDVEPREPERATATDAVLSARGISVHFGDVEILSNIDFSVHRGEIVALMGTNGAGKSTLLRAICGAIPLTDGSIRLGERDVTGLAAERIATLGIAQMPGGHGVFEGLTVAENLRVAAWLLRDDPEALADRTAEQLERFPILASRASEPAANLSGGQQQMLALAMAMLGRPEVLLIDELSLGLAPLALQSLLDVVVSLRDQGTSVVLVEQSVKVALDVADRACFMERGRMRFEGDAATLAGRPDLLRAVYLTGASSSPGTTGAAPAATARAPRPTSTGATTLSLREVSAGFGATSVLDGVSLSVGRGEILGIVGPNGAGKTTLFDVICGFTPASRGDVELLGEPVTEHAPARRFTAGLGRSFQDSALFPTLTVREALAVACDRAVTTPDPLSAALRLPVRQLGEAATAARVDDLLDRLGLGDLAYLRIGELSTGQRHLVDLGCVLAHAPEVILLDEPSSGVAQREAEAMVPVLADLRDQLDATLVVIEHDLELVTALADRLLALDQGQVVVSGTAAEVLGHPQVVASYLGTSPEAPLSQGASQP